MLETLREDFRVPAPENVTPLTTEMDLFLSDNSEVKVPPLLTQLRTGNDYRQELDRLALKMVGIEGKEADDWAKRLQRALLMELQSLSAMMRGKKSQEEKEQLAI